jgi:hypothetical protein
MIVVTSTAKHAATALDCAESVRSQRGTPTPHAHWFACADAFTLERATGPDTHAFPAPRGALENLIAMWCDLDPADIVVHLDGDDWLPDDGTLARVAGTYSDEDVWMAYGSFERSDGVRDFIWDGAFGMRYRPGTSPRLQRWRASHLKTFRAGLVQRLIAEHPAYLRDERGELFDTCLDRAVMLPLLELAGERYAVAQDVRCVYSWRGDVHTPAHVAKREAADRQRIHSMPPLQPLAVRPW